ncbi:MAG TPA: alpha/beta family hydrolase [Actinomycetes bacterium]
MTRRSSSVRTIATPVGDARVDVAAAQAPTATLVLGHGAGGGIGAADLVALAEALPPRGVTVVRVEQPWRVAGRKVATAPPTLDRAWLAVVEALAVAGPLVVGGRSAGARVACRTAARLGAVGCMALSFPLHPPGRPEKSRLDELAAAGVPTVVVQGERDAFGGPGEFPTSYDVRWVPFADHSFKVAKSAPVGPAEALDAVVEAAADWLDALLAASPGRGNPRAGGVV